MNKHTYIPKRVTERLKAVREREKMTQKQFAELIGINLRTYQNYESGDREITMPVFQIISVMGYSTEWLVSGDETMLKDAESNEEIRDLRNENATLRLALKKISTDIEEVDAGRRRRNNPGGVSGGVDPA